MKSLVRIAYHEAGHVVAAFSLGHTVVSATVEPVGDALGSYVARLRKNRLDLAHHQLLIILAGPLAEALHRYGPDQGTFVDMIPDDRKSGDFRRALEMAVLHHPRGDDAPAEEIVTIMRAAAMECQSLLAAPTVWRAVTRVAAALRIQRTLTGATIQRLIIAPMLMA